MSIPINIPILFVIGLPCSGKTEFLNIARSMPILCIEWSEVLEQELRNYREARKRGDALKAIENIVTKKGVSYFPEKIIQFINSQIENSQVIYRGIVVSGARNPEEIRFLAKSFSRSLVVTLFAGFYTRYGRSKSRGREKDPVEMEEFVRNDFSELNTGIAAIADVMAQALIFNDGELSEYTTKVRNLLESFFSEDTQIWLKY